MDRIKLKLRERLARRLLRWFLPELLRQETAAWAEVVKDTERMTAALTALSTFLQPNMPVVIPIDEPMSVAHKFWRLEGQWRRRHLLELLTRFPPQSPLLIMQGPEGKVLQGHLDALMANRSWSVPSMVPDSSISVDPQGQAKPSPSS